MTTLLDPNQAPDPQVRVVASAPPPWFPLFAQALAASRAGKHADAERLYRKLLKSQPAIPEAWANLGILEAQDRHYDASIVDSEKAISLTKDAHLKGSLLTQIMQLDARGNHWDACAAAARKTLAATPAGSPPNTLASAYLGISLLRTGHFADAVAPLRKRSLLIGEAPPSADLRLIVALEQAGKFEEAFNEAQDLAQKVPKDPAVQDALGDAAIAMQRFRVAVTAFGTAYVLRPDDSRAAQNAVASAMRIGRNDIAFELLKKMLKASPDDPKLHFELGSLYFFQPANSVQQFEEAETNLRMAAMADPKGHNYVSLLGQSILLQKKPQRFVEAGHLFDSALRLDPKDDFARLGLGYLAEQQVQFDKEKGPEHYVEAIRQYKAIIAGNRHDGYEAQARRRLAGIYITLGQKDDGYREFEALVARFPADTASLNELASIYFGDAKYEEAESAYKRLIKAVPENPTAYIGLGQTLERLKKPAEAQVEYVAALKTEPGNGTAALALGNLLKAQGKDDDAIAVYQAAVNANPSNNQLHLQLGSDYEQKDKIDDALKQYQALTILKDDPNRLTYLLMGPSLLLAHSRAAQAETILTAMYREYPKEDGIAFKLASAQEGDGHTSAAEATLRKLIAKNSEAPQALVTARLALAELLERLHRPAESIEIFEDTLRGDLGNTSALMGLSRVATIEHHPEAAGTFLESIALADPAGPTMQAVDVAQHLYEVMDRTPDRYTALLQQLTDKYPNDRPLAMRRMAALLDLEGIKKPENRVAADKLIQLMLVKTPNDSELHYRLGTIREADGRKAEAIAEYVTCVKLNYSNGQGIAALHRLGVDVPMPPPPAVKPTVATIPASGTATPSAPPSAPPPKANGQQRP